MEGWPLLETPVPRSTPAGHPREVRVRGCRRRRCPPIRTRALQLNSRTTRLRQSTRRAEARNLVAGAGKTNRNGIVNGGARSSKQLDSVHRSELSETAAYQTNGLAIARSTLRVDRARLSAAGYWVQIAASLPRGAGDGGRAPTPADVGGSDSVARHLDLRNQGTVDSTLSRISEFGRRVFENGSQGPTTERRVMRAIAAGARRHLRDGGVVEPNSRRSRTRGDVRTNGLPLVYAVCSRTARRQLDAIRGVTPRRRPGDRLYTGRFVVRERCCESGFHCCKRTESESQRFSGRIAAPRKQRAAIPSSSGGAQMPATETRPAGKRGRKRLCKLGVCTERVARGSRHGTPRCQCQCTICTQPPQEQGRSGALSEPPYGKESETAEPSAAALT